MWEWFFEFREMRIFFSIDLRCVHVEMDVKIDGLNNCFESVWKQKMIEAPKNVLVYL